MPTTGDSLPGSLARVTGGVRSGVRVWRWPGHAGVSREVAVCCLHDKCWCKLQ